MAQLNIQCPSGASLVVQWLRLLTSIAGSVGSTPVQGTRSHIPQDEAKKKKIQCFSLNSFGSSH